MKEKSSDIRKNLESAVEKKFRELYGDCTNATAVSKIYVDRFNTALAKGITTDKYITDNMYTIATDILNTEGMRISDLGGATKKKHLIYKEHFPAQAIQKASNAILAIATTEKNQIEEKIKTTENPWGYNKETNKLGNRIFNFLKRCVMWCIAKSPAKKEAKTLWKLLDKKDKLTKEISTINYNVEYFNIIIAKKEEKKGGSKSQNNPQTTVAPKVTSNSKIRTG